MITAIPSSITETREMHGTILTKSWRKSAANLAFLILFALFWDGFLVVWYTIAFKAKDPDILFLIFPLIHVLVGIGITYYVICSLFNKTQIGVSNSDLIVRHRPIPYLGNKTIPRSKISQIFCVEKSRAFNNQAVKIGYELRYIDDKGVEQKLLNGITEATEARYLESRLEALLGIEHQDVAGAFHG